MPILFPPVSFEPGHYSLLRSSPEAAFASFSAPAAGSSFLATPAPVDRLSRRIKRSTCPAVSTMRCVPVKNGWQLEHISTLSIGFVDLVVKLFPQAHTTVDSTSFGWIAFFI